MKHYNEDLPGHDTTKGLKTMEPHTENDLGSADLMLYAGLNCDGTTSSCLWGGGRVSEIGIVCKSSAYNKYKQSINNWGSSYAMYGESVAHEIAHQLGIHHDHSTVNGGTGSSGSDDTESQATTNPDHGEHGNARNSKGQQISSKEVSNDGSERHSRLFRLLQDSDYTDSEADSTPPSRQEQASNTLPRRGSSFRKSGCNNAFETSDMESASCGIERKHSFRSVKSSGNESGDSSVSGTNKVSPPSMRKDSGVKRKAEFLHNEERVCEH